MSDVLADANKHNWWYSDVNMATTLVHEVKALRQLLETGVEFPTMSGSHYHWKSRVAQRLSMPIPIDTAAEFPPEMSDAALVIRDYEALLKHLYQAGGWVREQIDSWRNQTEVR